MKHNGLPRHAWIRRSTIGCVILAVLSLGAYLAVGLMFGPRYRVGAVAAEEGLRSALDPPTQRTSDQWQVADDIALYHEAYGTGPAALVIHGGPGIPTTHPWPGLRDLEAQYTFHYYHQRGCGRSTRPFDRFEDDNFYNNMVELEQTLGLGAQVADIERIRRILGEEQLVLIGHSFGGFLATLYAAEFPTRVSHLILVAPAGMLSSPDEERDLFEQTRLAIPLGERAAYDETLARYMDFRGHFSRSERELAELHLEVGSYILRAMDAAASAHRDWEPESVTMVGGWATFAAYFSLGQDWDFRFALTRVTAATLILYGADDRLALCGSQSYLDIRGAQSVRIDAASDQACAGHMVFDQCPKPFAEAVRGFLKSK